VIVCPYYKRGRHNTTGRDLEEGGVFSFLNPPPESVRGIFVFKKRTHQSFGAEEEEKKKTLSWGEVGRQKGGAQGRKVRSRHHLLETTKKTDEKRASLGVRRER